MYMLTAIKHSDGTIKEHIRFDELSKMRSFYPVVFLSSSLPLIHTLTHTAGIC